MNVQSSNRSLLSNLPYDITSVASIFDYSKSLIHKTLRDFVDSDYKKLMGKGSVGQMVETIFFKIANSSDSNADFSAAGIELKCTPLKKGKSGSGYLIKERLVCNIINYFEVVKEDFEHSHFYAKCHLMLLLFYLYQKGEDSLDFEFLYSVLWHFTEKDLGIIKHDYEVIVSKIRKGEAHLLSEGDTLYLGACRKGQKGDSLKPQPFSAVGAPQRAFSLKPAYMRTVLQYVTNSKKCSVANVEIGHKEIKSSIRVVDSADLKKHDFESIVLSRFNRFMGCSYSQIKERLHSPVSDKCKSKFAYVVSNIAANTVKCSNVNQSEEFQKAGLMLKTIRVQVDGSINEAMSFENINYDEVVECDNWYDSRLYELFTSRFLFVVFRENAVSDYNLADAFFWTMPQSDLNIAEMYWENIRQNVLEGHIDSKHMWKASDRQNFHVRPKAQKASDLADSIHGKVKKYCYWFNKDYVLSIINSRKHSYNND